ncbi:MAG: hypothetical protein LLG00_16755 [Planctomycetaceae bacterium]|nr:hypothetical protein [Planctomycetaceae bacterium]
MKRCVQEVARWIAIAVFGGLGLWLLSPVSYDIVQLCRGNIVASLLAIAFSALLASPFLAAAYLCYRRRYRKLFLVLGVVGCFAVYALLMALPAQLGLSEYVVHHHRDHPWIGLLGLPAGLLLLFGPIYAAAWFYRVCSALAYDEPIGNSLWKPHSTKTRPTGWLVSLGLLFVLAPLTSMLIKFSLQPNVAPLPVGTVDNWIAWCLGLSGLGVFLMICGLVRRRPIPKQHGLATPVHAKESNDSTQLLSP